MTLSTEKPNQMKARNSYFVPITNQEIYDKWFGQSIISEKPIIIKVNEEAAIPQKLNKILHDLSSDTWIIFCDQDVRLQIDLTHKIESKDKECLYGLIGAKLKNNSAELFDGRNDNSDVGDTLVDSLGQCVMVVHSSLIKKHNLEFDTTFYDNFMIDFSLHCHTLGIPIRIISAKAIQNDNLVSFEQVEYYKTILRKKYQKILPVGLWGGILSDNELYDLKDYVKNRDKWINVLLKEKKSLEQSTLNAKLNDYKNMLDELLKHPSTDQKTKNIGKHQIELHKKYDELEKKLDRVYGTTRSGKTWLGKEILQRDDVRFLDEPLLGAHLGSFFDNPQIHWNLLNENYAADFTRIIDRQRDDMFFSAKYEKNWKENLRILLLSRIAEQFGFSGYENIIVKAPNESHASDILMKCLPESRLIFLIRDGRDVIDSRQGKFHNPRGGQRMPETPEERRFRIAHFAKMWNIMISITKKAFEQHNPRLRLLVKYEDLRLQPINEISKIFNFLNWTTTKNEIIKTAEKTKFENIPEDERGEDKNKRKAQLGAYKEYLTSEEIQIVNKIMKENLDEFLYDVK